MWYVTHYSYNKNSNRRFLKEFVSRKIERRFLKEFIRRKIERRFLKEFIRRKILSISTVSYDDISSVSIRLRYKGSETHQLIIDILLINIFVYHTFGS